MADEKQGDFDKKRPNYFQGMMLVDKDFRDEQQYHRQMRQNHNLGLHTWGVVRGLEVSLDASGAVKDVAKGLAIDASGQEIWWGGGVPPVTGASTEGSYLVIKWKEEVTERYPQMPDKPLRFIDTASFSWESGATDNVVLAQVVQGKADNGARRNAASVRANGNDVELRPVTRDGALRLKTGGDHQDFCAGATDVEYGTAYAGFNVARIRVGGASKWSFGGDGNNSGGALIFGDIFGKLRFVTAGSPGSSQVLDDQGILDRTRMTINQYGSVGIGTTDPKVALHLKFPGGARGNAAVLNLEGTDHVYMQWYPAGYSDTGRKGWIGYGSANNKNLTIQNEYTDGYVSLLSGGGRVGIGVPDPQGPLDVKGDFYLRGGLWFANEQGRVYANGWIGRWGDAQGGPSWLHLGGITEGGTRRLMLVADKTTIGGNVGIGTPDPQVSLHLKFPGGVGGNAAVLNLEGTDHVYMQWYPAGYSVTGRKGWIGYGAANDKNLTIKNEYADGHLNLFSASGKVGIGTDSPASTLHIRRDVSGGVGPTLLLHNAGGGTNTEANIDVQTYGQNKGPNFRLRVIDNGNFGAHVDFSTKPTGNDGNNALTSRLYIKADGNVGIGETNPECALEVKGDIRTNVNDLYFTDKNHGIGFYGSTKKFANEDINGPVVYGYDGGALGSRQSPASGTVQSIALRWKDGIVSIGKKLKMVNNVPGFSLEPGDASPNAGYIRFGDSTGWKLHFGRAKNGATEVTGLTGIVMTLQDKGGVGIGTTDPGGRLEVCNDDSSVKVKFGGTGGDVHHLSSTRDLVFNSVTGVFTFRKLTTSYYDLGVGKFRNLVVIYNSQDAAGNDVGDVAVTGRISCGGRVAFKSSQWNNYISARGGADLSEVRMVPGRGPYEEFTLEMACSREFKENIAAISVEEALATLQNLNPVKYDYKGERGFRQNLGFIAEEMPDNLASEDRKSISPFEVIPVLTRVAKEQQKSIARLQAMILALQEGQQNRSERKDDERSTTTPA